MQVAPAEADVVTATTDAFTKTTYEDLIRSDPRVVLLADG